MKLYSYWRSSSSWRVRIALAVKNVAYVYAPVHLVKDGGEQHDPGHHALNPLEQVPVLEVSVGGHVRRISQSLAIMEYLDEAVPTPALLPADPWLRARARQMAEIANSAIQPFQNLSVLHHVKHTYQGDGTAWAAHWIDRGLAGWEELAVETAGRHLVGDSITVADACLVPQLYAARRFGVDLTRFPGLCRAEAAALGLPAFQVSHPDRQPDAVTTG